MSLATTSPSLGGSVLDGCRQKGERGGGAILGRSSMDTPADRAAKRDRRSGRTGAWLHEKASHGVRRPARESKALERWRISFDKLKTREGPDRGSAGSGSVIKGQEAAEEEGCRQGTKSRPLEWEGQPSPHELVRDSWEQAQARWLQPRALLLAATALKRCWRS